MFEFALPFVPLLNRDRLSRFISTDWPRESHIVVLLFSATAADPFDGLLSNLIGFIDVFDVSPTGFNRFAGIEEFLSGFETKYRYKMFV